MPQVDHLACDHWMPGGWASIAGTVDVGAFLVRVNINLRTECPEKDFDKVLAYLEKNKPRILAALAESRRTLARMDIDDLLGTYHVPTIPKRGRPAKAPSGSQAERIATTPAQRHPRRNRRA